MQTIQETTELFRDFIKKHRLRLKFLTPSEPIAISSNGKDHLYEGFANGFFGVWVERDTERKLRWISKKLIALGCIPHQWSSVEATFKVKSDLAIPVARFLKIVKKKALNPPPIGVRFQKQKEVGSVRLNNSD